MLRVGAIDRIRKPEQEARKGTAVRAKVRIVGAGGGGGLLAESKLSSRRLLLVVILVGTAEFAADVKGVATFGPHPVVHNRNISFIVIDLNLQPTFSCAQLLALFESLQRITMPV